MGRSLGAGYPLTFRCARCKTNRRGSRRGLNYEIVTQIDSEARGACIRQDREHKYLYNCLDCGHSGWTRHVDAKHTWESEKLANAPEKLANGAS